VSRPRSVLFPYTPAYKAASLLVYAIVYILGGVT
jgi:hypothetical protein